MMSMYGQIIKYVDFFLSLKPKLCWSFICFEQLRGPNRIGPITTLVVFWEPHPHKNCFFSKKFLHGFPLPLEYREVTQHIGMKMLGGT